jgi:hypothetical protein
MGVALTTLTQVPVPTNTFTYGGDSTQKGRTGFFGKFVQCDIDAKNDCFKANFIFIVKKLFSFLDWIGVGTCFFGITGFQGKINECERYQTGLDRNRQAREKIVNALGGSQVCERIPSVSLAAGDLTDYLKLGEEYFQGGQWVVQGEDQAGRKFAAMRIVDGQGNVNVATAHQRYRETHIDGTGVRGDGSLWTVNFKFDLRDFQVQIETDAVATFIEQVRTGRHPQFSIAPKP